MQHGTYRGHSHSRRGTGARTNPTQGTLGKDPTPHDWIIAEILLKRKLGEGQDFTKLPPFHFTYFIMPLLFLQEYYYIFYSFISNSGGPLVSPYGITTLLSKWFVRIMKHINLECGPDVKLSSCRTVEIAGYRFVVN